MKSLDAVDAMSLDLSLLPTTVPVDGLRLVKGLSLKYKHSVPSALRNTNCQTGLMLAPACTFLKHLSAQ